jgi:hypothetical protein
MFQLSDCAITRHSGHAADTDSTSSDLVTFGGGEGNVLKADTQSDKPAAETLDFCEACDDWI